MRFTISCAFKLFFFSIVLFVVIPSSGVRAQSRHLDWSERIGKYRAQILQENPRTMLVVKQLTNDWDQAKITPASQKLFLEYVIYGNELYPDDVERLMTFLKSIDRLVFFTTTITTDQLNAIVQNKALVNLMSLGVINLKFPFLIDPTSTVFNELEFYNIKPKETLFIFQSNRIAFCLLINLLYPNNELVVVMDDKIWIETVEREMQSRKQLFNPNHVTFYKGFKRFKNESSIVYDMVILRDVLHHIERPRSFWRDLELEVESTSRIFIFESLAGYENNEYLCKDLKSRNETYQNLKKQDIKLLREENLDAYLLMEIKTK